MPLRVVLDANVLYPFSLRDTLLRVAERGFVQIYWSDRILEEAIRNLVADLRITDAQGERLRSAMMRAFPDAMVSGYEALIPMMPNAEKDRHVSAAATFCLAHRIVTFNLRDFDKLPEGIEVCRPQSLLLELLESDSEGIIELLREQAHSLTRPPRTFEDLLSGLAKTIPSFVKAVRARLASGE